jgi:simple sugar transport system permease protein
MSGAAADRRLLEVLRMGAAIGAAMLAGLLITALASATPGQAFLALTTGALPELHIDADGAWHLRRLVRFGAVLEDAITLTLLGLAMAIPFRARQFSLGADGQMFLGALAAAAVSLAVGGPWFLVLPAATLAAILTGMVWGLVPGLLKVRFQANEIVTTLMLNVIAVQFYQWVIVSRLRDPLAGFPVTAFLPPPALLPVVLAHTNVTIMLLVAPLLAGGAWLLLMRTTPGYEIRLAGEAPAFARQAGMPVTRAIVMAMAVGGAFAGLAGLHLSNALLKRMPVDLPAGMAYEGLVVALLARNDPRHIPLAAFFYAYLRTGAQVMERTTDVSRDVVLVIQACIILFVVAERLLPPSLPATLRALGARHGGRR